MADRKVLNKYYPPDFDPTKLPRLRINPVKTFVVRIMAPFNMRCNTCGEYIYKGKKFNSKKEDVLDMDYLGLKIFRFFIKCTRCLAEISFRTDPENTDYVCEQGATRNFQAHDFAEQEEKRLAKQEEEDETNPMKALEKRTKESKNEMDVIDALEELKDLNARHANADINSMLETVTSKKTPEELADEEDNKLAQEVFEQKRKKIKRLEDDVSVSESADVDVISNFSLSDLNSIKSDVPITSSKTRFSNLVKKKVKQKDIPDNELKTHCIMNKGVHDKFGTSKNLNIKEASNIMTDHQKDFSAKTGLSLLSSYSSSESD